VSVDSDHRRGTNGGDEAVERRSVHVHQSARHRLRNEVDGVDLARPTRTFFCLRKSVWWSGAMSPSEEIPVATARAVAGIEWLVIFEMTVALTSARYVALAAVRSANPDPVMTT